MIDRAARMRCLLIGDIIGKPGRLAVVGGLPAMRAELDLDLVIANGENLAAGAGLTPSLSEELLANGVDVITSGNHIWDKREIYDYLDSGRPVLRPLNYPDDAPGRGWLLHTLADGDRVAVVNVMGRVFMNQLDSPFAAMDGLLDGAAEPLPAAASAAAATAPSSRDRVRVILLMSLASFGEGLVLEPRIGCIDRRRLGRRFAPWRPPGLSDRTAEHGL